MGSDPATLFGGYLDFYREKSIEKVLALSEAAQRCTGLELLGLGSGVPRRIKRVVAATLSPVTPPAEDIQAIVSVYR